MTAIGTHLNRQLAKTVAVTGRWREAHAQPTPVARTIAALDFFARGVFHVWRNRRYLSLFKLANMAAINLQCALKTERVVGLPYRMKIEPTNICNTHCQLCPTGIGLKGRDKGKMTFERYAQLIDELKPYLYTVDLSMWGDPLIVPDIYRMIRHTHDAGIWTYISSNLHAYKLGKGQAEQLVESGLDMLTCSLHGASQGTYETYQPGKRFEQSVEKIREIVAARERLGSETPVIQLNFVVTKYNQHEVDDFRRLAEGLGCRAVFSNPSLNVRFLNKDKNLVDLNLAPDVLARKVRDHLGKWLPDDDEYVIEPYRLMRQGVYRDEDYNGKKAMDCQWPWKDSVINWDGSVVTCCGVFDQKDDMGNVFETPFRRLWNGEAYRMARRSFKRKVEASAEHANPCRDCPGFMV